MSEPTVVAPAAADRRGLLLTAGAVAALAGAGLAWWRYSPQAAAPGAEAQFWTLQLETPTGQPLALAGMRGRPLLVNFWATWCPPCIEELPLLNDFFKQNSSKGWQVIGLAVDQTSSVVKFLDKHGVDFPIAMAGGGGTALSKSMGNAAGGLPFTVVFGADGRILARKIGKVSERDLASWGELK